ncbi:PB1 domain-containing protein tyrosine kinase, partial [Prunus dulcis]
EAPGTSGQQFCKDTINHDRSNKSAADDNENHICAQTGEEFSAEFLQDRISQRRLAPVVTGVDQRQSKRVGFNLNKNHKLVYEDLAGKFSDEVNRDRVIGKPTTPPLYVLESPQSYHPYGQVFSEGSFSFKMKFLCSFGGRILPRPNDGKLRYVGGDTRILSIRKGTNLEELMNKTFAICNQPHTIKYQLPGEDLDALVSVCSDEDLHHMIEEYLELERTSQRLRIFLVPLNETESPSSVEARVTHPIGADSQFVFAVNGMLDPSPRKSSSGQSLASQTSQFGNTSDYSPTFRRESPTATYLETKDYSPSSSNVVGTLTKPAPQFLATLQIPKKSFNHSPPISPVPLQHRDPKSSNVQFYLDRPYCDGNGGIAPSVMEKLPCDNTYYLDAVGYNENLHHGPPVLNYHHHNKYLAETSRTRKSQNVHSHNRSFSENSVPSPKYGQGGMNSERLVPLEKALHSEKSVSHPTVGLFSGSADRDASHHRIMHAVLSDSQLQEHVQRSSEGEVISVSSLKCRRAKSPSLKMQRSSQEWPVQQEDMVDGKHEMVEYSNQFTIRKPDQCKEEQGLGMLNLTDRNDTCADKNWNNFEGSVDDISNDTVMEFKKVKNVNCLSSVSLSSDDSQFPRGGVSGLPISENEGSKDTMGRQGYEFDTTSQFFLRSQSCTRDQQCATTERISGQPGISRVATQEFLDKLATSAASDGEYSPLDKDPVNYPEYVVENVGLSRQSSEVTKCDDAIPVQSQCLDNHHDNKATESVVVVEDLTNSTPPGIPSSKVAYHVSNIEDEDSDECSSPREIDTGSTAPESDDKGVTADGNHRHETISDVAIAEMEAGIYGLQIIKNDDLEELQELGSGTYGTVYHGKWRGTDVAIKRIKKSCFSGRSSEQERLTKDFWREAKILSTLHHPNVVAFYGVVPDGPGATLATVAEFMVNGSLRHVLIRKDRVLDRRKRLIILMDAAFGMEYLHLKNIVHFDLKCDNLLVNLRDPERPICKVGDFGLSRIKRNTLVSGGVRGTLPWMAPELLNGSSNRVSEKVDVYSFGIVMWEILTGEEPYANMHCGAIIGGIVNNTLRPPIPKRCDSEWKILMEQCWSPDPADRPSFTEITHRLRDMSTALQKKRPNLASR